MFQRRAQVREELALATDDATRATLRQRLSDIEQALALRLEGMRQSGKL
jgi:hypothetical protein